MLETVQENSLVVCEVSEANPLALENKPGSVDVVDAQVVSLSTDMSVSISTPELYPNCPEQEIYLVSTMLRYEVVIIYCLIGVKEVGDFLEDEGTRESLPPPGFPVGFVHMYLTVKPEWLSKAHNKSFTPLTYRDKVCYDSVTYEIRFPFGNVACLTSQLTHPFYSTKIPKIVRVIAKDVPKKALSTFGQHTRRSSPVPSLV
ncbi:hypothetical protein WISP_147670 [Willisornis vidua]|uniref:Uncharacterized protein n=1 Tax=Willisornis vidua TaxID=1566151 RepID=A0ABQ9CLE0_9PASS|nr:hypothetical protein WISP_147670 [Willisornis vidua]